MSTALKKNFILSNGLEVEQSIKIGDQTITSLLDSSAVVSVASESSTAKTISKTGGFLCKSYDSANLLPLSGNDSGEFGFVSSTNRLYIWNGSGWYNIALINTTPTLSTTPNSNYTLDSSGGTAVTVTMVASDPEEVPITYSYLSDSASNFVTITQDSGVFTLTTLTQAQLDSNGYGNGGTFSITFRASDGVNIAPAVSSFTLDLTITYNWSSATQSQKFENPDPANSDYFGRGGVLGISDNNDTVVVGVFEDDDNGSRSGSGYIFTKSGSTWSQAAKLTASDGATDDRLFYSTAISGNGDIVVAGAWGDDSLKGAFYVFEKPVLGWATATETQKLIGSDMTGSRYDFGQAVGISRDGSTIASFTPGGGAATNSTNGAVYVFTRSPTYYDVSAASYASKSYTFTAVENSPTGFAFNSDGTKLIIVGWQQIIGGSGTGGCYQYSLSTAYDVSTATYDSVSFNLGNEMVQPMGIKFSSDGTRMFVIDNQAPTNGDVVFQYNLSTGFDISTASYSNNSLNVNPYENVLGAIDFKPDGTKMFLIGAGSDTVRAWDLSSAWDLSTASYASETFSASSQEGSCTGLTFNGSGTKMYVTGYQTDSVYQYSLSTAWDVSSASYDSVSFDFSTQDGQPRQIRFNSDGSKLWMIGTATDSIYQYNTVLNWQQQAKLTSNDLASGDKFGSAMSFTNDGNILAIGAWGDDDNGSASGSVYIFTRSGSTWTQRDKIKPSNGSAGDRFGFIGVVGISDDGNTLAVGTVKGSVYVFNYSNSSWSEEVEIDYTDVSLSAAEYFGQTTSLSGDGNTLAIGNSQRPDGGGTNFAGAAYVFQRSSGTWTLQKTLYDDVADGASNYFGDTVKISYDGSSLLCSSWGETISTVNGAGAVYLFTAS